MTDTDPLTAIAECNEASKRYEDGGYKDTFVLANIGEVLLDHWPAIRQHIEALKLEIQWLKNQVEIAVDKGNESNDALRAKVEEQQAEIERLRAGRDFERTMLRNAMNEIQRLTAENESLQEDAWKYRDLADS